jgi:SNF2 family DNA or RNA helicase
VGLNLQAASIACYYSLGYSLIDRLQSEDRCHRSGSEIHNRVLYVDFLCENSIDPVVRNAVAEKKEVAEIVVDLKRAIGIVA